MRGVPGFRRHPGMRELPQPGRPDGSRGFASVPWLHEGRSRRGLGPAGTHGRERFGCGVTDVPCLPWARTLPGGAMPSPRMQRAASSGAFLPGASPEAPQGAASSRTALGRSQAPLSACSRQLFPASRPGAQARRRRPAAATCPHGAQASSLPPSLRGQVVTTLYVVGSTALKPAWFVGFRNSVPRSRKVPESASGRKRRFFAIGKKSTTPMFDLVRKAKSDARLAGQGFGSQRDWWAIARLGDAWR